MELQDSIMKLHNSIDGAPLFEIMEFNINYAPSIELKSCMDNYALHWNYMVLNNHGVLSPVGIRNSCDAKQDT